MSDGGKHIKIQVYGVEFGKLRNVELIEHLLSGLVRNAGMRELDSPWVYDIRRELERQGETPDPLEPEGVTGIVVLSTSHVAIHTWPHRGYAVLDVYSCKDFSSALVADVIRESLEPKHLCLHDMSYALDMPLKVRQVKLCADC